MYSGSNDVFLHILTNERTPSETHETVLSLDTRAKLGRKRKKAEKGLLAK